MSSPLNPPQREAIRYLDGPLLVLAGAGSGKTRVITQKIAYLIEECGFNPSNIAAITFTNKAAKEMQERVGFLLKDRPTKGLTISTFHSLGVRILREEAKALGYKPKFSIFDSTDCFGIVSERDRLRDHARHFRPALLRPKGVERKPSRDGVEPRDELASAVVVAGVAHQAKERLLGDVLGVAPIGGETLAHANEAIAVAGDQRLER